MSRASGRSYEVLASRVPVHRGTTWSPPRVCLCTHQCCSCPYSPISTIKTASFTLVKIDLLGQFWQHRSSASKQATNEWTPSPPYHRPLDDDEVRPIPGMKNYRGGWKKPTVTTYYISTDRSGVGWESKALGGSQTRRENSFLFSFRVLILVRLHTPYPSSSVPPLQK